MKSLTILIAIVYFQSTFGLFENVFSNLKIPEGFDITNLNSFKGFNPIGLDGQVFNPFSYNLDDIFQRYMTRYNKNYAKKEAAVRKQNLKKSIDGIIETILRFFEEGIEPTFTVGLNGLSDLSRDEYKRLLGARSKTDTTVELSSRKKRSTSSDTICQPKTNSTLPTSWDWRSKNVVTSVKNQGQCGSCWTFASSATIESQWALKTTSPNKSLDLSEQDLLNCAPSSGCNGGTIDAAFQYVISNGQAQESAAPYVATVTQCKHYPLKNGTQLSNYCVKGGTTRYTQTFSNGTVLQWSVTENNTDAKIMRDLYENGPIVALINASDPLMQNYKSGVYNSATCSNSTNHAVTLVGWGVDTSGAKYWIVKNSWGTAWGEQGYFRMAMGANLCGINQVYYYPIMANATLFNKAS